MRTSADVWAIHLAVLLGVAVVGPLALGGRWWRWAVAAVGVALAFRLPTGVAAAGAAAPFLGLTASIAAGRIKPVVHGRRRFDDVIGVVAGSYGVVAAVALVASRAGWSGVGIDEPIVELTAVHYLYAGVAALVLAARSRVRARTPAMRRAGSVAVVLTAATPPVVALGFVTTSPWPQVGGAGLLGVGVWITATLHLAAATSSAQRPIGERALFALSGLAPWIPMVLAVAWAAGQHWDVPALSIPDMARTHGAVNGAAFVLCALVAGRLERRRLAGATVVPERCTPTRRPTVRVSASEWIVVGAQRGAVLGSGYGALIVMLLAIGSLDVAALAVLVFALPLGAFVGAPIGIGVGAACALVDRLTGRRFRPDHLAAIVLVLGAGSFAAAMRHDLVGWLSLIGGPAGFGLLSLATHPIVRPRSRGERGGSLSPSGATSVRTAGARCAGR